MAERRAVTEREALEEMLHAFVDGAGHDLVDAANQGAKVLRETRK
jgi:hypothetical protein